FFLLSIQGLGGQVAGFLRCNYAGAIVFHGENVIANTDGDDVLHGLQRELRLPIFQHGSDLGGLVYAVAERNLDVDLHTFIRPGRVEQIAESIWKSRGRKGAWYGAVSLRRGYAWGTKTKRV